MPVKRRILKQKHRVSPAAVAAFKAGDWWGVYHAIDMRPWETHPMDVDFEEPAEWVRKVPTFLERWNEAVVLRRALVEASTASSNGLRSAQAENAT